MSVVRDERLLKLQLRLAQLERRERSQGDFLSFVRAMWPEFIAGEHHRLIAGKLERIASGELKRLIVNMPPRHTKSEFASYLFPAWMMGRNPSMKIIQATHTTELAVSFGRKVKNLLDRDDYKDIFDVRLAADSKASGRWDTDRGGMYYAVGVGSNLAGRGGDLVICDDPHSEQTAMSSSGFEDAWDWYTGGPRQRLQPGGAIIVVMCMTGDTLVLLPGGEQRPLRDIRPGDEVVTYDKGVIGVEKILNWRCSGVDSVFKIRTRSGRVLRANKRHPFLVDDGGERKWIQLQHLRPGMFLVGLRGVTGQPALNTSQISVPHVRRGLRIIGKTLTRLIGKLGLTGSGKEFFAPRTAAGVAPSAAACATTVTAKSTSPFVPLRRTGPLGSRAAMVLRRLSTTAWSPSVGIAATSAGSCQAAATLAPIGMGSCASTTATRRTLSAAFFATTATLRSAMGRLRMFWSARRSTYDVTLDEIVGISPDGEEEVFDVEVARTENFIANGVVSHNTRWSEKDLTGQLLKAQARDPRADQWEVLELPAILPSGKSCWPEYWPIAELEKVKASIPPSKWNAQYQQSPTGEDNAILKREWWKIWEGSKVPELQYVIQSYDTAFSKSELADYSAITTWGVFQVNEGGMPSLMLLDAEKGRWDFPELKRVAWDKYKFWEPETVIIEAKATGTPLTHELRQMGIPVVNFTPSRGKDKISRAHSIAPLFEAGMIWAPDEQWAHEVIEECAAFPNGEHDDYVDSMTQALMRYRQGNFVQLPTDDWGREVEGPGQRVVYYG